MLIKRALSWVTRALGQQGAIRLTTGAGRQRTWNILRVWPEGHSGALNCCWGRTNVSDGTQIYILGYVTLQYSAQPLVQSYSFKWVSFIKHWSIQVFYFDSHVFCFSAVQYFTNTKFDRMEIVLNWEKKMKLASITLNKKYRCALRT